MKSLQFFKRKRKRDMVLSNFITQGERTCWMKQGTASEKYAKNKKQNKQNHGVTAQGVVRKRETWGIYL